MHITSTNLIKTTKTFNIPKVATKTTTKYPLSLPLQNKTNTNLPSQLINIQFFTIFSPFSFSAQTHIFVHGLYYTYIISVSFVIIV